MATFREYDTLVSRCGAWSVEDLGDLLHEIDRDRELDDSQRAVLQDRLYRLIWERAQPRIRSADERGRDGCAADVAGLDEPDDEADDEQGGSVGG